jgi:hypothetical protein
MHFPASSALCGSALGAAWPTKSGSGYNADLIALPVDGKFIHLPPKDKEDASE